MAAGAPDSQPLAAGLSAQQLVTPMQPVVSPDAVTALVDAFHKGIITAGDINDRIGAVAQANKKAHLEQLSEFVSPEAIQSRMAQFGTTTAQSQLQTQQAQAASGLVQPLAEKTSQDIIQANHERLSKAAVDAYTQWNPPIYKRDANDNPTSEYDYEAMAREGSEYLRAQNLMALASIGLKGEWQKRQDPKTGAPIMVYVNANGEDVTPQSGNKTYEFYQKMRQDALTRLHAAPDTTPHVTPVEGETAAPAPTIEPAQPQDNALAPMHTLPTAPAVQDTPQLRAQLIEGMKAQGIPEEAATAAIARTGAADLQPFINQYGIPAPTLNVTPIQPPAPVVAPSIAPVAPVTVAPVNLPQETPSYLPGQGIPVGPSAGVWQQKDIAEELRQNKVYENWAQTRSQVGNFLSAARAVNASKPDANFNVNDVALAESLIKMADAAGTIREFKWNKFEDHQPLLDKLKAWQNWALGKGSFTPGTRQELIKLGKEYIKDREEGVKPVLQLAEKRTQSNPDLSLDTVLDPADQNILAGKSLADQVQTAPSAPTGLQTLPSGRRVMWVPNQ